MNDVFINCPFDNKFNNDILRPLLFVLLRYGLSPKLSLNRSDSGELRLEKIIGLMKECTYSIHDLSKLKLKRSEKIARMNMPFELGIDWGLRNCGIEKYKGKKFLILTSEKYEYKKALSDISGYDVENHENNTENLIKIVRDWLITNVGIKVSESATKLYYEYIDFIFWWFQKASECETDMQSTRESMTNVNINEFCQLVTQFTAIPNNKVSSQNT